MTGSQLGKHGSEPLAWTLPPARPRGKLVALGKTPNGPEPVSLIPNVRMIGTPHGAVWALTTQYLQCTLNSAWCSLAVGLGH